MTDNASHLAFALPDIGEEEIQEVVNCLRSGWLTTGHIAAQFEKDFAAAIGAKYAAAVNSATAGLHLALEAIGIEPGDKVLTTPYTFTASAEVIRYLGADPLFVDIESDTFNLSPELVESAFQRRPEGIKAILPVHLAGQSCPMDRLLAIAGEHGVRVVEDAAHALPATFQGRNIGTLGDATVFSFYATKPLATGEGGMVTTDSEDIFKRIKIMRLHGISRDIWDRYTADKPNWYYEVVAPGFKYNMPDIIAAIGIHQLKKTERFHKRRKEIAEAYDQAFADLPLTLPHVRDRNDVHAWHLYVIKLDLVKLSITRDVFIEKMAKLGVGTSVHFIPLHLHPYWRDRYGLKPGDFPVASDCFQRVVSLPIYPKMTGQDVDKVISAVRKVVLENFR